MDGNEELIELHHDWDFF